MKNLYFIFLFSILACGDTISENGGNKGEGKYQAYCQERIPMGSHTPLGWCGPKRKDSKSAEADGKKHEQEFSHKTFVCDDCPTCEK